MNPRSLTLPGLWLVGVAAFWAGTYNWPWTIAGKRDAVVEARLSGNIQRYQAALNDLRIASPGLASLELLDHPELVRGGKVDVVGNLKIALAHKESAKDAYYRQLEYMLKASQKERDKALRALREMAREDDAEAIEMLADADEAIEQRRTNESRLPRKYANSATARRALGILLGNPQVAISQFQIRDITQLERRLIDREASAFQAASMVLLADRLITEEASREKHEQALKLYRDAIARGSLAAKVKLGLALRDLPAPYRDVDGGISLLKIAAREGSTTAAYELGETYRLGKAVPRNIKLAVQYYQTALRRGSTGAIYRVGDLYLRGDGLPRDPKQAIAWFTIGAQRGNAGSKRALGLAYLDGVGVEQDVERGLRLLEEAAASGDRSSMSKLAFINASGRYSARDYVKAGEWAIKAIAAGERNARVTVLAATSLARTGNSANLARATDLLRDAMRRKDPLARRQLADLLLSSGGSRNEREALKLLEEGAFLGDPHALAALGAIYATGNGVRINPDLSLYYYTMATRKNNPEGMRGLAIAYAAGFGVKQDLARSISYYEGAASLGDRTALQALASCALQGCTGTRDVGKAQRLFANAAALGDAEAMYQLATLQIDGAIPGGQAGAIVQLKAAAALDHVSSIKLLKRLGLDPAKVQSSGASSVTEEEAGA